MKLDNSARINTPGVAEGNWSWRVGEEDIWKKLAPEAKELRAMAEKAFRWVFCAVCFIDTLLMSFAVHALMCALTAPMQYKQRRPHVHTTGTHWRRRAALPRPLCSDRSLAPKQPRAMPAVVSEALLRLNTLVAE